jgi:hypothetical protein
MYLHVRYYVYTQRPEIGRCCCSCSGVAADAVAATAASLLEGLTPQTLPTLTLEESPIYLENAQKPTI